MSVPAPLFVKLPVPVMVFDAVKSFDRLKIRLALLVIADDALRDPDVEPEPISSVPVLIVVAPV